MKELTIGRAGRILGLSQLAKQVSLEHVYSAVAKYDAAKGKVETYEASSHYNVVVDGNEYPPKAIFGLALSESLGMQVKSSHFSGGEGTPCFRTLQNLGFEIVEKKRILGSSEGLAIYRKYNRQQIASIFAPEYSFKPGTGTWGLQGIIADAPNAGDYVLIVTLGNYDGNDYEDYLTEDGALVWKSQNRHTPESKAIKDLVAHDPDVNTVSLFVRPNERSDYYFLGPLVLRDWDPASSKPVKMIWDVMNWPMPDRVDLPIQPAISPLYQKPIQQEQVSVVLEEKDPPKKKEQRSKERVTAVRTVDWLEVNRRNHSLGDAGERLVLQHEIKKLTDAGRADLAEKVERVSLVDSSAGYDIRSYCPDSGEERYIEVKTTRGGATTPFYISSNEVEVSSSLGAQYVLFRIYGYSEDAKSVSFYTRQGEVTEHFKLQADVYKAIV